MHILKFGYYFADRVCVCVGGGGGGGGGSHAFVMDFSLVDVVHAFFYFVGALRMCP